MDSQTFLVLSALFLVFTSGCVLPSSEPFDSKTPVGTGVIIEHFGPDYQKVYSGEEVEFVMKVKNTGTVKAKGGFAELLGLDQIWEGGTGTKENIGGGETFPNEMKCRYTSRGINLLPGDPDAGIEGGTETCTWTYTVPEVFGEGVRSKPRIRFFYSYSSSTIKTVTLVSREELKTIQNQGRSLPVESYSKTGSPISLDMETATPIRTYGNRVIFPVIIKVTNVGGGTVCSSIDACKKSDWGEGSDIKEGWYSLKLMIDLPPDMQLETCQTEEHVTVIGKDTQTLSCKVSAVIGDNQVGIVQKNIGLHSEYGYFIDKTSEVFVYPSAYPGNSEN